MAQINSLVEKVLKKHGNISIDKLTESITDGLENRFLSNITLATTYGNAKKMFVRKYFEELFIFTFGNISKAAKISGLNRRHIHRIIKTLNIKAQGYRSAMRKPYDYIKEDIKAIIEDKLDMSKSYVKTENLSKLYTKAPKMADSFTKELGFEPKPFDSSFKDFEKEYFHNLIKNSQNNLEKASDFSKLSIRTIQRKMKSLKIAA